MKVGINGFGRIGRISLRAGLKRGDMEFAAINSRNMPPEYMAYLFKYDTVHGRFDGTVDYTDTSLVINDTEIPVFGFSDPAQIPWGSVGADYVIDATGAFKTMEKARAHMVNGAKKVITTYPSDDAPMFVMGVNQDMYDPAAMDVVSNASCTTNCLAPVAKVLNDNFGIASGLMSTVHAATSTQPTVDNKGGKDWRYGRAAFGNIIPTTTGAAKAVGRVIPQLSGKLTGMSFRVPLLNVSVVDLTVNLEKSTSYDEICKAMKQASEGSLKGILGYTEDMVVSSDFIGVDFPSVFDAGSGIALTDSFYKLVAWYDNEWGYSCNMLNMLRYMFEQDNA